jgi:regulator of RNase E activity RraB
MTETEIQECISGHRSRNNELRRLLMEKGRSLTEETPIDIHFWGWDQIDAAVLAKELYRRDYLVTVIARSSAAQDEEQWNVEAGAKMSLQKALSDEFTEDLVRFAVGHNCIYDGWGTAV